MREAEASQHTPGCIYYTRSIHLRNCSRQVSLVVISSCQKQSINDASQYVVVLTHPPEGVGMDVAKIQKKWELNVLGGKK